MEPTPRGIRFETPERLHAPISKEREIALWIVVFAGAFAAILFGNYILAVLLIVGVFVLGVSSRVSPRAVICEITSRGVRVDTTLFPYETLRCFGIDEVTVSGVPKLILHSKKKLVPYVFINLLDVDIDAVRHTLNYFLAEDRALKEPMVYKLFEYFGF